MRGGDASPRIKLQNDNKEAFNLVEAKLLRQLTD